MTNQEFVDRAEAIYTSGYKAINVTMKDGSNRQMRLFVSGGRVCVFKRQSKTRGYEISSLITRDWASIKPYGPKGEDTIYEHFLKNLRKYQIAFTKRVHPNLWTEYQAGYKRFSIDAFKAYVEGSQTDVTSLNALHEALREYCHLFDINHIIFENRYKTTSIGAFPPDRRYGYGHSSYNTCILNIQRHLDNKQDFHYSWRGSYDVTVSGSTGKDGLYRAWLSLEFRGTGNGHYYILINSTSAVFTEDD